MKILILSQYFWPEEFLINDFALGLRERGHEVEVLTGLPNYPSGKFFRGYGWRGPYRDNLHGIPVWRSPLIPRGRASGGRLAVNYFSFALFACLRGCCACRRRFDVILVFETSPVTVGIPARVLKALTGAKLFFWVQDLWPESLVAAGAVRSKTIINMVGKLTRWIYKGCDRILISSRAFRNSIVEYGGCPENIYYLPNFAEDLYQPVDLPVNAPERSLMPSGFKVMFAGNIGEAQDFETILGAAALTAAREDIQWVVLGDGRRRHWVEGEVKRRGLTNVHLLGRYPKSSMPSFFSLADVMLVSLKREPIFALTVPAKVQSYFACGKPVIAALEGEGARIIREAQAGFDVPASTPTALAEAVLNMADMDGKIVEQMGENARKYYDAHFTRAHVINEFLAWVACGGSPKSEK